jgi:phosphoserine phosphatase
MIEIYIIRPGCTAFDEAGRIKGSLDLPLSEYGQEQAKQLALSLQGVHMDCLFVAPCASAIESAERIAERNFCRQKTLECLRNLDHGLWQGKLMSEIKRLQPTFYRQFQENPIQICPPSGETVQEALNRLQPHLNRLLQRHEGGTIGFLAPEPLASILQFCLGCGRFGDIWKSERDSGTFTLMQLNELPNSLALPVETA